LSRPGAAMTRGRSSPCPKKYGFFCVGEHILLRLNGGKKSSLPLCRNKRHIQITRSTSKTKLALEKP
jgi:hypothetical protein